MTNCSYILPTEQRGRVSSAEKETVSASDEDTIADLLEQHQKFMNSAQYRLTKLQVIDILNLCTWLTRTVLYLMLVVSVRMHAQGHAGSREGTRVPYHFRHINGNLVIA